MSAQSRPMHPLATKTRFGVHIPGVIGVGRRGTLAQAKRTGKARPHKYWAISKWHDDGVVAGPVPDESHGKFKTKKAAQEYLDRLLGKKQRRCPILISPALVTTGSD